MAHRIIFPARGEVALEEFVVPPPGSGEVRVHTQYSLMSIGTETTILHERYEADTHFDRMFAFPQLKTGVQALATVTALGPDVDELAAGDTVFVRVAHASDVTVPAVQVSPVPAGIDSRQACWCGLAKTAFRAAHVAPFEPGGNALIVGAGPVGQMVLRWAHAFGMQTITVADAAPERLAHAERGGATQCVAGDLADQRDVLLADAPGDGFDIVVDTTGNPAVFSAALSVVSTYGKLVLLGDTGYPSRQCLTSDVMTKGLTIVATHDHHDRGGWDQRRIDDLFFKLVRDGEFPLDELITHEYSPADCVAAYALASNKREQAMGVLFDWTTFA